MSFVFYPPNQSRLGQKPTKNADGTLEYSFGGRAKPYDEQPALEHWEKHYKNFLVLSVLYTSNTNPAARQALAEELDRCETKLEHWKRHVNWKIEEATRIAERLKNEILPGHRISAISLTIENRWRVKSPKLLDPDTGVGIDEFIASGKVKVLKEGKSRPRTKRRS